MDKQREVKLARTLGLGSIILLGVGALLGGGIFTLLGPAAGLAGPGLFLAMILGGGVAFLNLHMYIALGTTFPEAGGGYLWTRKGLGPFQGFLAGWFSWFAHMAAGGLYALSFGYYVYEVIITAWTYFGDFHLNQSFVAKLAATLTILIFGYLNWKGTRSSGKIGNFITAALICVLLLFVIFGAIRIFTSPAPLSNFTPFLPNGWLGILAAASFFYIAFEGSEIQVQTSEETKDPRRNLKIGLFSSWIIVTILYILISLVIIGATKSNNGPIWQIFANWGEGAIVKAAQTFMPFGRLLMIIGGLFANLAALNATIYSSSRVSYALARDKSIWSKLADIHLINFTPHLAVIVSGVFMIFMVNMLPLFDIASAASLLFVLLFLQLNLSGISIHYKWPDTKWAYKIPLFPILPIAAVIIYIVLAATMLQVNITAWIIVAFWLLIGLVNYFSYAQTQSREQFETGIVYEETVRIGPKIGKRILWPISPHLSWEEIKNTSEIAFALASKFDGEVVVIRVHEIPPAFPLDPGVLNEKKLENERIFLNQLQDLANDFNKRTGPEVKDINFHGLIMIGRDLVDVILDVIRIEECDALLLNWGGLSRRYEEVLNQRIDRLIRESNCDVLILKNPKIPKKILLTIHPTGRSPYAELMGEITDGLKKYFQSEIELFTVIDPATPVYLKPDPTPILKSLNMKKKDFAEINFFGSKSVINAVLNESNNKKTDLIIIGSSWPRFLKEIRFGRLSETIAKNASTSVLMIRGHGGAAEVFWKNLLKKLIPKK